jgi:mRNA interferase MazF
MAIKYALSPRTIVLCDYDKGGFRPPEMVKRRPAVVLVGRLPHRDNLHTVVPLSGTPSHGDCRYHCQIVLENPLPAPFAQRAWWVKADMVATVGFDRLDLFRTDRDQNGKRRYLTNLRVSEQHFDGRPCKPATPSQMHGLILAPKPRGLGALVFRP